MKKFTIAFVGNPNCGKTTLFNSFTGSRQTVGNWPGVTVEHKEGNFRYKDYDIDVIDLPRIYSFSAFSADEKVSRDYILNNKPDVVVNIIDASNLERNLYLTTQLLEMKVPIVIALNMMDVARQKKISIEIEHLEQHLGCPVVPIIASKKTGLEFLKDKIVEIAESGFISNTKVCYDSYLEDFILQTEQNVAAIASVNKVNARWLAIKLLEDDELAVQMTEGKTSGIIKNYSIKIEKHTGDTVDLVIADGRYGFIHGLTKDVVHKDDQLRKSVSDTIDKVVLNRMLGLPIFMGVMYLVFLVTIKFGQPFIDVLDQLFGFLFIDLNEHLLTLVHSPEWLKIIISQGIGGGIQTVGTFIPPIFFMFLSLSFLEDSGYMARAAFVMDKFMRYIGLPGKAFIPMLIGFGCNVPAIMATRTLENEKDRLHTILINPLISCGARMPVYAVFAVTFFPGNGGFVIFSLYLTGIILAILSGLLFKNTILKGKVSSFVMELPPYHIPTINGILLHTWLRLQSFLYRAGKIILLFVIIISLANSISIEGKFGNTDIDKSILSYFAQKITPIFKPMGIDNANWPATVGLITGVFAKESVIGTLNTIYSHMNNQNVQIEEDNLLSDKLYKVIENISAIFSDSKVTEESVLTEESGTKEMRERFGTQAAAYAYLLFVLIYTPCIAVIGAIYKETGWKWALFSTSYLTFLAWTTATIFYSICNLINTPTWSIFWIAISFLMILIFIFLLKVLPVRQINEKDSAVRLF